MRLVAVQHDIQWEDAEANFARVEQLLEASPPAPDSLVALPEMFSTGYSMDVDRVAEKDPSEAERFLSRLARRYRCWVAGGLVKRAEDGFGRNELAVFDRHGHHVGRYLKNYGFSYAGEPKSYRPGNDLLLFHWQGFVACPTICYDLRFPELYRRGVAAGASLFLVIANWPAARLAHWRTLLQARAIENQAVVVGVNRVGRDPKLSYAGHSMIIDHRGTILQEADDEEAVISAALSGEELQQWRREFPALEDIKRPALR